MARNCHDVMVILAIEADLRFISHRDTARLLERALMRSGLPVAYSEGFNPHMKRSLLLPRSVGMATCGDLAVVGLTQARTAEDIEAQLRPQMPTGARIVQALPSCVATSGCAAFLPAEQGLGSNAAGDRKCAGIRSCRCRNR